jgi:hypothetical protein
MPADPLQPLMDALRSAWPQADQISLVTAADQLLRTHSATFGDSTASLTFGQGNDFRDATISIGSVAGRDVINLTINFPQPINPQAAILQQLLYHHESATIFANRLDTFVGRESEITEIRQCIAQVNPTGGYVTITAQAGEGKSSVIAQMVNEDGPQQTAFHFIALTPGREYQLSLLRPIVARLILKHGLPTTYFPETSYAAMRDLFHSVLRQLSEHGIQEIIYIDGLDQLESEAGGTRDLSFLPNNPPSGIVLVLGTRPDDTLHPLEGKKVQMEYRLPHLSYPDFNHLLIKWGVVTPAAHRLYTALQGNAFYLALVVQELKAGPIVDLDAFIRQISDNPENLFGVTIERLQWDDDQWKTVLEPVLGLLLVAQEPLDRATIRSLIGVGDVRLRRGLGQLGGLVAQDANGHFFLYHIKVRNYLAEDVVRSDKAFVVSQDQVVAWHTTLAQWCVREPQDIERIWEDTTGPEQTRRWYARHHYVTHLVLGAECNLLCQLIDEGIYGRYKRRFDPSTQLYAQDLDWARDAAVATDDLHRLWRWSLLRVNLTSQMDAWPDALFLALIHLGRGSEALRRVELLSDSYQKSILLGMLAPTFDGAMAQQVWDRAQATAAAIIDDSMRIHVLSALAVAQTNAQRWANAQITAVTLTHDRERARALSTLAAAMAQAQHPDASTTFARAATAAAAIRDHEEHANALIVLGTAMAQAQHPDASTTFARAATAASGITGDEERANALIVLAAAMAQAQHPDTDATFARAAVAAAAIRDESSRARALSALAAALAQAQRWTDAQTTIATITDDSLRAGALRTLYHDLLAAGNTSAACQGIAAAWRNTTTRTELLTMAKIAHPLIAHDPALGREMVKAFTWVDDQLRDG